MHDEPTPIELEQYLLLLLSDSNLPSGGFVASSGLESYIQHGLLSSDGASTKVDGILRFVQKSLHAYARLQLPFLAAVYRSTDRYLRNKSKSVDDAGSSQRRQPGSVIDEVQALDAELDAMTLNHVARRASTAQGIAMLTLYERAFAPPLPSSTVDDPTVDGPNALIVINEFRRLARTGQMAVHLSTGFAVLTASLGLSLGQYLSLWAPVEHTETRSLNLTTRAADPASSSIHDIFGAHPLIVTPRAGAAQHLYLFLHARSILSSAVRLNTIGPYVSHKLLLHDVRLLVDQALRACAHWRVNAPTTRKKTSTVATARENVCRGAADDDDESWWRNAGASGQWQEEDDEDDEGATPVTTWPLSEILAARHDQLHSKIFNS